MKNRYFTILLAGTFIASFLFLFPGIADNDSSIFGMMTGNHISNSSEHEADNMAENHESMMTEDHESMMTDDHMSMIMDGELKICEDPGIMSHNDCEEHGNLEECNADHVNHEECNKHVQEY